MSLKDRVQVEPLDDDRWGRIERGVVASLRARSGDARARRGGWRWAAGLGAAVACAAAAGVVVWRVARPDSGAGARAAADSVAIATEAHGTRIQVGDAVVEASPETAFTIARPGGGVELVLARGRIDLDVPHRADRAPLVVHAGDVDVIDVGTIFTVARGDAVTVDVREGLVQVVRGGRVARVAAGQHWSEPMVATASVVPAPPAPGGPGPGPGAVAISGGAPSAHSHDAAIPIGGPSDLLQRPHNATAPEGTAPARRHGPSAAHATTSAAPAAGGSASGSDVILDVHAAIRGESIAPAVAVAGDDAFAAYQDMMQHGTGGTASQGVYGMARTRFAAGRLDEAMQWLDFYVRRFTSGDETEAVLWLRVRIRCEHAIDEPCRAAAQTYLDRYAGSHRGRIAELVTNTR